MEVLIITLGKFQILKYFYYLKKLILKIIFFKRIK